MPDMLKSHKFPAHTHETVSVGWLAGEGDAD